MINFKPINWMIFVVLLLSCNSKEQNCDTTNFKELNLHPSDVVLQVPSYKVIDTMRYDAKTELNYRIRTLDSLLDITAFIYSYERDPDALLDITQTMRSQKEEIKYGRDTLKLITEGFKSIDSIKIGFVKYLVEQKDQKFYDGRIFFYRGKKLVLLWLFEMYRNDKQNRSSMIDCILENIQLK